jgi:cytochrome b561
MATTATATGTEARYNFVARVLHWLVALLVLGSLSGGTLLWSLGFEGLRETFGLAATNAIYTAHKTVGVAILGLVVLRLAWRLAVGAPAPASSMSPAVARLSRLTHGALYALLIAMPVLGWAATAAGGFPVQFLQWNLPGLVPENEALSRTLFAWHGYTGLALGVLALVHIAGALRHRFILKDGVLRRIALP